jgi:hypothetical protein
MPPPQPKPEQLLSFQSGNPYVRGHLGIKEEAKNASNFINPNGSKANMDVTLDHFNITHSWEKIPDGEIYIAHAKVEKPFNLGNRRVQNRKPATLIFDGNTKKYTFNLSNYYGDVMVPGGRSGMGGARTRRKNRKARKTVRR